MSEGIVLLRRRGEERSAIARVDAAAVELLASGQATTLQAARAEVILADLCEQREHMAALLADLRGRAPIGEAQIGEANANLITAINKGIVQIDLFVAQARAYAEEAIPAGQVGDQIDL
ncbi:hypothetical protein MKK63_10910 [Methylobacterium sp. J-088]|uniref:hypothetical protein n=1 Tax=Methylobacterium sp. J-088 TaxID=2836664 RepID=UPI001FB9AC1C|nr:hypothetical protein [Methylobacterium sp. J-088]MCJ2063219.1 hypothetical protein [Methylobacterium sp. J-088]